jgi:hypothetical protein
MLRSALTFGWGDRPWRRVRYPDYPEIGRVEPEFFRPEAWRSFYPNPAHERLRADDALWAVRILMRFPDEGVRAIVHAGQYSDPAAEAYLADTIIERRNKVTAYYLSQIDPLTDFRVDGEAPRLVFRNLGKDAGLAEDVAYEYAWFTYENATGRLTELRKAATTREAALEVPVGAAPAAEFLMVRLRTVAAGRPRWRTAVDVYLRHGREVVGIDRET